MERRICLHGHFYQPPRENPWLDVVEREWSARPFHDWNQRITDDCYRPNTGARILDARALVATTRNTFADISFNVGRTLHAWLGEHAPDVDRAVRDADRRSAQRYSGHGSALAQPYVHAILPLAEPRDRRTLVAWGIADFRRRFDRDPEGMWLPETAVDVDTLDALAEHGIRFTVLAPHQARRVRPLDGKWLDVAEHGLDTTVPYHVSLASGRTIAVFFFDGPLSQAVAFERRLLDDGERLARRLTGAFSERKAAQLLSVVTDGETFGHHHRFGEMALARALQSIERDPSCRLTNFGEHLAAFPPQHEVEIAEATAWSCGHGIERWRSDCGCSAGGDADWNQAWRAPLRESLDWLRSKLATAFETRATELLRDPWAARDGYGAVLADPSLGVRRAFVHNHSSQHLGNEDTTTVLALLEAQRHLLLAFTSCAWFFADPAGVETTIALRQAGRAIELTEGVLGEQLEAEFLERLAAVRSNDPAAGDGRRIWERHVRGAAVGVERTAAVYATRSVVSGIPARTRVGRFEAVRVDHDERSEGPARIVAGAVRLTDTAIGETTMLEYAAVEFGDYRLGGGVRPVAPGAAHRSATEILDAIAATSAPLVERGLRRAFPEGRFDANDLPSDEQEAIVAATLPAGLAALADTDSKDARAPACLERAVALEIDATAIVPIPLLDGALVRVAALAERDAARLGDLAAMMQLTATIPRGRGFGAAQDAVLALRDNALASTLERARSGDADATEWLEQLRELAATLRIALDEPAR